MANKMLIDASHPEETRVVVVRGNRVEEFDFESANRRPLRGNIYLAKVTRVEPSLQACFVDYGGNRHGFLAFSEIHPDYYQIPTADREALIAEEEREARAADQESERRQHRARKERVQDESVSEEPSAENVETLDAAGETNSAADSVETPHEHSEPALEARAGETRAEAASETPAEAPSGEGEAPAGEGEPAEAHEDEPHEEEHVESVGGGAMEEVPERPRAPRRRHYKIQEVIKRRQVMLVQVVKEERGTKGAAMTTYLSLACRYSVLMPNTSRGGGISRKITDGADRRRLKDLVSDLEVPQGMGVILRTAGASRTKAEIGRDFDYLLRLWENVRELTLQSSAPALVYEEGSLTKRAIRDLYNKDIDEVLVAGEEGHGEAREFMKMLQPSHVKNVKLYQDAQPLFVRFGIESQLDAMFSPVVQLKSGGYIVINPTEALVAIDVNSGRSTREHHIEDTALRTNMEAAEEVARQLRLRDLAGLIVIDFIDMEQKRNNRHVERKLKDCLKDDRARIQVGRISHFGLMEMSRQRIRAGVLESSTTTCPACGGTGHVRSVSSVALHLLRTLEEHLTKSHSHDLVVRTKMEVATYLLNQKRAHLRDIEQRFGVNILIQPDATVTGQQHFIIEKGAPSRGKPMPAPVRVSPDSIAPETDEEELLEDETAEDEAEEESTEASGEQPRDGEPGDGRGRRRRRRRGRGGRGRNGEGGREGRPEQHTQAPLQPASFAGSVEEFEGTAGEEGGEEFGAEENGNGNGQPQLGPDGEPRRRRRRGRRGGRRNRRDRGRPEHGPGQGHEGPEQGQQFGHGEPKETGEADVTRGPADSEPRDTPPYHSDPRPEPMPRFEPTPFADTPAPEAPQPKRRSTVREPAPMSWNSEQSSTPPSYETPATVSPSSETNGNENSEKQDGAPSRSGWWKRR
jgi:ribonuclease E